MADKDETKKTPVRLTDHLVMIGVGLGIFYWIFEAFFNIFLAKSGLNPFQLFTIPDSNPGWTRLIVLCLFIMFGAHAQFVVNERREAAKKMEREAATRERFRRLLSPDLAERVVSGELKVEQGGEDRIATVMFADVKNFTKMSENIDASELLKLVNDYFEVIVDVVFRYRGTVDKFIGDEIMVIWGAPVAHENDPASAVYAALEIQKEIVKFNKNREAQGLRQIQFGISLNTGKLVAGYIGSSRTMSYSVIGDTVNVSHGLCTAAEAGQIIISKDTYDTVKELFEVVNIGELHAKGREEPIPAYNVIGKKQ